MSTKSFFSKSILNLQNTLLDKKKFKLKIHFFLNAILNERFISKRVFLAKVFRKYTPTLLTSVFCICWFDIEMINSLKIKNKIKIVSLKNVCQLTYFYKNAYEISLNNFNRRT